MELPAGRVLLHVLVFDWDSFGADDFLGESLMELTDHAKGNLHSAELELADLASSASARVSGRVRLQFLCTEDTPSTADAGAACSVASTPRRSSSRSHDHLEFSGRATHVSTGSASRTPRSP